MCSLLAFYSFWLTDIDNRYKYMHMFSIYTMYGICMYKIVLLSVVSVKGWYVYRFSYPMGHNDAN